MDFSGVNASREGLQGQQGSYMLRTARFLRAIQKRQTCRIFFLLENIVIRNDKNLPLQQGDLHRINQELGLDWDPIELDAKDFSPCRRKRHYFTNIPCRLTVADHQASDEGPNGCLEDGYCDAATFLEAHEKIELVKAQTFMASQGRIDDERMMVYRIHRETEDEKQPAVGQDNARNGRVQFPIGQTVRKEFEGHGWFNGKVVQHDHVGSALFYLVKYEDNDEEHLSHDQVQAIIHHPAENTRAATTEAETETYFESRPINVLEREAMMGFPKGYVQKPGACLYR